MKLIAMAAASLAMLMAYGASTASHAEERLPWQKPGYGQEPPPASSDPYNPRTRYEPPARKQPAYRPPERRAPERRSYSSRDDRDTAPRPRRYERDDRRERLRYDAAEHRRTYSENEILDAGHRFFGSISTGLAKAIAKLFRSSGRPNGYILGEDAGGAFVAGLRYGEGTLYTKTYGARRIYWQGPTVGYDFGGEGSRTMTLVYNMRRPRSLYRRFAGVQGSAYVVGGVGVQFLKHGDITLAPIRSGVGLRLGANIGYLKYTRRPTWNPF